MSVGYELREGIAYISFNRSEKHNALRDEDITALIETLQRLDADEEAQLAILFGQGRSFSSGGDVSERLQRSMEEGSTGARTNEAHAFVSCENWKPVIAAVHGYCLGHALMTALYCDHLVAARSARFQVTEIRIGLPTAASLPRLGSPAFANEVAMTGRMFTAEDAWHGGMVTRLVEDGEHLAAAEDLARQILENPQWAVRENVRIRRTVQAEAAERYRALYAPFEWTGSGAAREAVSKLASKVHGGG